MVLTLNLYEANFAKEGNWKCYFLVLPTQQIKLSGLYKNTLVQYEYEYEYTIFGTWDTNWETCLPPENLLYQEKFVCTKGKGLNTACATSLKFC